MFICRLSLNLNFGAVSNTFLQKLTTDGQLKMEWEVAPPKIQDDGKKVIKLQAESFYREVHFS